jgi:hypothetical protein
MKKCFIYISSMKKIYKQAPENFPISETGNRHFLRESGFVSEIRTVNLNSSCIFYSKADVAVIFANAATQASSQNMNELAKAYEPSNCLNE